MNATACVLERHAVHAMGTRFEFVAAHEDAMFARDALEHAAEVVLGLHRSWSFFDSASVVSAINRGAEDGRAVRVDDETFALLELCERVYHESGGAFDITASRSEPVSGVCRVLLDARMRTVRLEPRGLRIDPGAIAKGWALHRAAETLRECGISDALLHGGTSSVVAMGTPQSESGWRVRIGKVGPVVLLRDVALGVSMQRECDRPGHIVDPQTGQPARGCVGAACIMSHAALADAWSTAAIVLGRAPGRAPEDAQWYLLADGMGWRAAGLSESESRSVQDE